MVTDGAAVLSIARDEGALAAGEWERAVSAGLDLDLTAVTRVLGAPDE